MLHHLRLRRRVGPALAVLGLLAGSFAMSLAAPDEARADTASERAEVQRKRAAVASEIDTLRATNAQVEAALSALNSNVATQTAALRDAERRSAEADAALTRATELVVAKQAEIAALDEAVKDLAVETFIRPPSSASLVDSLESETIGEAELKQSLLEAKSSSQLDALDQLDRAREDLELAQAAAEDAAAAAEREQAAVDARLDEVTVARDQQAKVVAEVESRLDRQLAEAAVLDQQDQALGAQLAAEQAALAKRLAAQRAAAAAAQRSSGPVTISITGSGSIVSVRGIRIHQSIADNLAGLLSAAQSDGISLSGWGYRDSQRQIQLRRQNCGSSNYAVYQMSPSACSPPTARPGASNHERGLAVDFTYGGSTIKSRSSPAFQWLRANAARYGFYNLPSEPWHWSVNGN
ncbi:D-alanyl-D-alanine carboxypeptidase family protein [Acidimicrobiia bacterium EGI L10123]|uniref:D-alanyl-D-alanine carboxypeptidase family protein n=1 Tax=Salinilacustrithrix flava TaxID=2957203 RepID=UPI003D7C22E0|nr:D-alanyl-D-alanine carboxypeptidase family protein [Acidimicrobiia bacterium EGI L10123]